MIIRSVHGIDQGVTGCDLGDGRFGTGGTLGHHPALLPARARSGANQPARAHALQVAGSYILSNPVSERARSAVRVRGTHRDAHITRTPGRRNIYADSDANRVCS